MSSAPRQVERVLRVLTRPNLGGPTRQVIALWHAHRAMGLATLLVTGKVDDVETELSPAAHGVPAIGFAEVLRRGRDASGWLELDELGRGLAPFRDRRAGQRLRRLIAAFEPEVVHTHTSKAGLVGRRAAWRARVPVVAHTFHGHVLRDYFGPLVSWALARTERALARRTHLLFAVSRSCADEVSACGVAPRERFRVLPPAVATEARLSRAAGRLRLGLPPDRPVLAVVGRLEPIKRIAHAIEALRLLPEHRLEIFGDGRLRGELQALAGALAPGRVALRGAVPEIGGLLPAFDALLVPSVREGCPLVAIEAFAAGVPVVGYDVPGVRDALGELGGGWLVPVASGPRGLAAAVLTASTASPERAAMLARGCAAAEACRPERVAASLLAAYRDAATVADPGRGAGIGYAAPCRG